MSFHPPMPMSEALADSLMLDRADLLAVSILAHASSHALPEAHKRLCGRACFGAEINQADHALLRKLAEIFLAREMAP